MRDRPTQKTCANPPYLYRPTMQVVQPWLIRRELSWFWAYLNLLPAPLIAAVFCEQVGGSRTGREPGRRSWRLAGVLDAAAGERIMPGGRGQEGPGGWCGGLPVGVLAFLSGGDQPRRPGREERGSQPYLGPRGAGRCPGDKMIDGVPQSGVRPLRLIRPPAWPIGCARTGRQRLTAARRELAAVVSPSGECGCVPAQSWAVAVRGHGRGFRRR